MDARLDFWIEWAEGPAFRFAIAICLLGLLRHVVLTVLWARRTYSLAGDKVVPWKAVRQSTLSWLFPVRHIQHRLVFSAASIGFHAGVILAPPFLAAHVLLIEQSIALSWPTLPVLVADILTIAAIAGLLVVFVLRLWSPSAQALNRIQDYALPPVVALPFISGFLASHPAWNPFPYQVTLLVHVLSGNLLLVLIPLTKLAHLALQPATQLITELGWHFPPDGGEKVARALGKENQPI
ncbi:MAG: hypothetical protein AB1486_16345 [Planctomycetota bacterium]